MQAPASPVGLSDLSHVGLTGIACAICHATESRSATPLLHDPQAEAIDERLRPMLAASSHRLMRRMGQGQVQASMVVHLALRARKYDQYTRDFLKKHPGACVVNLGAGLDTRFWRIDDGSVIFYDLDLPPTIALKRQLTHETDRYRMIGRSALDHAWIDEIAAAHPGPTLILAEGLFMYLPPAEVRALVLALQRKLTGCELVFETANARWLRFPMKQLLRVSMRSIGLGDAKFVFGLDTGRDIEAWGPGIRLLEEYFHSDEDEPRIGFFRDYRRFDVVRRAQWTVRCALDPR